MASLSLPHIALGAELSGVRDSLTTRATGANVVTPQLAESLVSVAKAHAPTELSSPNAYVNSFISLGHAQEAGAMQHWVEQRSRVELAPVWSSIAQWASPSAGDGMISAEAALDAIAQLRARAVTGEQLLERAGTLHAKLATQILEGLVKSHPAFSAHELADVAAALVCLQVGDVRVLANPRILASVADRWVKLFVEAQAINSRHRGVLEPLPADLLADVETIARTLDQLLGDGNQAIWNDMGVSVARFMALAEAGEVHTPEDVFEKLSPELPGASADQARASFAWAKARLHDAITPQEFEQSPHALDASNNLAVAAFALYTEARNGQLPVGERNALITMGNNLILFREQHDLADPVFHDTRVGEVNRAHLMQAITPLMQVPFAHRRWTLVHTLNGETVFSKLPRPLQGLATRLHNWLKPPVLAINWAEYEQRFHPIQLSNLYIENDTEALMAGGIATNGDATRYLQGQLGTPTT